MKRLFVAVLYTSILACNDSDSGLTRTTASGIRYIIHHPVTQGKKAVMMSTAKLRVINYKNDTPVTARMPLYQMVLPPAPYTTDPIAEVLVSGEIVEGDSVIAVTKDNQRVSFAVQKIYVPGENGMNTDSLMQVDKNIELQKLASVETEKGNKRIEAFLSRSNITAEKTQDDVYAVIADAGKGITADSGKKVGIKFTVSELYTGKVINSNRDTAFHQPPVLEFEVGRGFMLKPVEFVMARLGAGGKAKIYVPGVLVAGSRAGDASVDLEKDVLFDVEVVRVSNK